ncbi:MAG: PEP/pyruvate-binding domain-containing protein [Candidatus Paceibacterota bacterium]|jgi:phosphoenolpyruvate synthase/pyruvate phosphate dikinase
MEWIRWFEDITKDDTAIAGGKGASLGEMTWAGIPVPPGFVILSSAYEKFKGEGKMSEDVAGEIKKAFKELGVKRVAVRSSATAEDSKSASWAGQLESYLNTTEENLLENVEKCWESLFTIRAVSYRSEQGLDTANISVAVVVQEMVEAETAGVAFSVHPVTEDHNQMIIEAVSGLGEKLVSGQVTPDSYVVAKNNLTLIDVTAQGEQKLSEQQIKELAKLVIKIENHYGFPVDVEWAYAEGKFWIVQSRPITTLREGQESPFLPEIRSAEFWARENSMPLFWLTNPNHDLGNSSIFFYKKKMCHCFYLNGSHDNEEKKGYAFFSKQKNRERYLERAEDIAATVKRITQEFKNVDFKKLSDEKMRKTLVSLTCVMEKFSAIYTKTEASRMKKFERVKANHRTFKKIGEIRLKLRRCSKEFFFLYIGQLLGEIARRNKIRVAGELFFYDFDELTALAKEGKKVPAQIIAERTRGHAVLRKKKQSEIFLKKDADQLWHRVKELTSPKDKAIIVGSIAYPGKVTGKARVIFEKHTRRGDVYAVQSGEVLVTDMTKPDMIAACKRSVAIVTDEGGIVSHAAILSREFKIPCIVGTKVATQILKTGDLIEVDATNGIVRVIKKARRSSRRASVV